jgi:hypothetical protein
MTSNPPRLHTSTDESLAAIAADRPLVISATAVQIGYGSEKVWKRVEGLSQEEQRAARKGRRIGAW